MKLFHIQFLPIFIFSLFRRVFLGCPSGFGFCSKNLKQIFISKGTTKTNNKNILIGKTYFETSQRIAEGTGASHLSLTQQETMKVQRNPRILLKCPTGIVFTGPWIGDICFYSFIFLTRWLSCKKIQGQQTVFPVIITWTVQANNTSLPVYQLLAKLTDFLHATLSLPWLSRTLAQLFKQFDYQALFNRASKGWLSDCLGITAVIGLKS